MSRTIRPAVHPGSKLAQTAQELGAAALEAAVYALSGPDATVYVSPDAVKRAAAEAASYARQAIRRGYGRETRRRTMEYQGWRG